MRKLCHFFDINYNIKRKLFFEESQNEISQINFVVLECRKYIKLYEILIKNKIKP